MTTISPAHYALCIFAATIILAGCGGGSTSPSYQPSGTSQSTRAQSVSSAVTAHDASCQGQRSYQYIGHREQHFRVPKCATSIYVDAVGAAGGGCCGVGGRGGEVSATIPVTRGEKLIITVGSDGNRWRGGFNGGGEGTHGEKYEPAGGGGGASDVRQGGNTLADRVVVGGGGGGEVGGYSGADAVAGGKGGGLPDGGSGGTPVCDPGTPVGGGGGTQSSGGTGGAGSNGGSLGNGGVGASDCFFIGHGTRANQYFSSGGGGGYYGGGGGGNGGAGGGGSGYAEPTATNVSSKKGVNSGNGLVLICWGYSNGECGSR